MSESLGRVRLAEPTLGPEERRRVDEVLRSGALAAGDQVRRFEEAFADHCGTAHAIATANGTAALHTALHAAGIGPGDRVLTTPFSFIASTNAIRFVGAEPAFVDIDPATYAMDVEAVEAVLDSGADADAMLAVHLYGLPGPIGRLSALAEDHGLVLVEDAAQAHGAESGGRPVGSFGDVGCFSFYPTKNMTTGEGGMLVTDRADVARRAARFVNHGRSGDGEHEVVGYNFRMTDIAAAIGREQLQRLPVENAQRRENAAELDDGLADLPVTTPVEPTGRRHVYHQYTIRTRDREGLRRHLDDRGVDTGVYYPTPIHEQPPYRTGQASYPEAERAAREVLSLPVHPRTSPADRRRIVTAVRGWSG